MIKIILKLYEKQFDLEGTSVIDYRKRKQCHEKSVEDTVGKLWVNHKTLLDFCITTVEGNDFP